MQMSGFTIDRFRRMKPEARIKACESFSYRPIDLVGEEASDIEAFKGARLAQAWLSNIIRSELSIAMRELSDEGKVASQ